MEVINNPLQEEDLVQNKEDSDNLDLQWQHQISLEKEDLLIEDPEFLLEEATEDIYQNQEVLKDLLEN